MLSTIRGFRIHYDLLGPERADVVCMTHSMTSDSGMWSEQVPTLLAAGFQVLRLDMRGHGGSDGLDVKVTLADLANDVIAAMDELRFEKAHYVGLSIGGMIGLKLAIDHGTRFKSMLLADTSFATPGDPVATAERMHIVQREGNLLSLVEGNMERRFGDNVRRIRPERWNALRQTLLATKLTGYLACTDAMQNFNFESELPGIRLPMMIVCGSDDVGTPPDINRKIASLVPGAAYEEIAGGRHFPNVEFPERFNSILIEWLRKQNGECG